MIETDTRCVAIAEAGQLHPVEVQADRHVIKVCQLEMDLGPLGTGTVLLDAIAVPCKEIIIRIKPGKPVSVILDVSVPRNGDWDRFREQFPHVVRHEETG